MIDLPCLLLSDGGQQTLAQEKVVVTQPRSYGFENP